MNSISFFPFLLFLLISIEITAQNYDAEIIKYSTSYIVDANKIAETDSVTIQINNRAGDDYSQIAIPYSKTYKISDLDAWIEDMNGLKIRGLKKSEITEKSAISNITFYEDHFQKCFKLGHNNYPYRIVYTFKTSYSEYITLAWWSPHFSKEIPTKEACLRVKLPKKLQYSIYENKIQETSIDSTESSVLHEWKFKDMKPVKGEIFSQPEINMPLVVISPESFKYGVEGSLKNWAAYGNWNYRLVQGLDVLPLNEKSQISSLINGIIDKKEIVKILYHYLQDQTHYIFVSIGLGGLKPYPASYVAHNKFGDCKALSNYMKSLLSYAGIPSFCADVYASNQPRPLIRNVPGQQFNHVVVAVPFEKDTLWLENTSNTCPFGYIGTSIQNREALLISENNSRLVKIPAIKKEDNQLCHKLDFDLNINGQAVVTLKNSFKGSEFERFNQLNSNFNDKDKDNYIREYMPFNNYEVVGWVLNKIHRDTAKIELQAIMRLSKYLKPLGKEYYFDLYPVRIPSFPSVAERKLPVSIPYPIYVTDTLTYNLPKGYELKSRNDSVVINSEFGNYKFKLNIVGDKIRVVKLFELRIGEYSIQQYADLYSFIQSVKEKDNQKLIIKPIN